MQHIEAEVINNMSGQRNSQSKLLYDRVRARKDTLSTSLAPVRVAVYRSEFHARFEGHSSQLRKCLKLDEVGTFFVRGVTVDKEKKGRSLT